MEKQIQRSLKIIEFLTKPSEILTNVVCKKKNQEYSIKLNDIFIPSMPYLDVGFYQIHFSTFNFQVFHAKQK